MLFTNSLIRSKERSSDLSATYKCLLNDATKLPGFFLKTQLRKIKSYSKAKPEKKTSFSRVGASSEMSENAGEAAPPCGVADVTLKI